MMRKKRVNVMGKKRRYFGIVEAQVDDIKHEVWLVPKRGRDPVDKSTLTKCIGWASRYCRENYPGYQLVIDGQ